MIYNRVSDADGVITSETVVSINQLAEFFQITPHLRWHNGVLEQAWHGSNGGVKWEAIETVEDEK